jgi:hypothetical protein
VVVAGAAASVDLAAAVPVAVGPQAVGSLVKLIESNSLKTEQDKENLE